MPRLSRSQVTISRWLAVTIFMLVLSACQIGVDSDSWEKELAHWPSGLIPPIDRATFSTLPEHNPGSPSAIGQGVNQGFDFVNGYVGRVLGPEEIVIAVADGRIIRANHHETLDQDQLRALASLTETSGLARDSAQDLLRGRQVWIEHPTGHVSRYFHLATVRPDIVVGQTVLQGEPIGLMGSSGLVPETASTPAEPRLRFELWTADGERYLGQGLSELQTQMALLEIFGENAVARAVRNVAGGPKSEYAVTGVWSPPVESESVLNADIPDVVQAGNAFTIPVFWSDEDFEASTLMSAFGEHALSIIPIQGGALLVGVAPLVERSGMVQFFLGGVNQFGHTMIGERQIRIEPRPVPIEPLEVDAKTFDLFLGDSASIEQSQMSGFSLSTLSMTEPNLHLPFEPPVRGEVVGTFGQDIAHDRSVVDFPVPGLLVLAPTDPEVRASNDGVVIEVSDLPIRGLSVVVGHGAGIISAYSRLESVNVEPGQWLRRGDVIGSLAADPDLDRRVLLWEIYVAGVPSDPLTWVGQVLPGIDLGTGMVQ